jgi:hypothetical protein
MVKKNKNDTSLKNKNPINNPLNKMDPITQVQEFKDNVNELNANFKNIVKIVKPMVKNGLVMPCTIAKKISNTLCSLTENANNKLDLFNNTISKLDLENITNIPNNLNNISGGEIKVENMQIMNPKLNKIIKNTNANTNANTNTNTNANTNTNKNKKSKNFTGRYFGRYREQQGGSVNDKYKYITNPESGRKVLLHGRIGRNILKKYINRL